MTSNELGELQKSLETFLIKEIKEPLKNWSIINSSLKLFKEVDTQRRKAWHDEKFGVCEEIAEKALNDLYQDTNFTRDDIPF